MSPSFSGLTTPHSFSAMSAAVLAAVAIEATQVMGQHIHNAQGELKSQEQVAQELEEENREHKQSSCKDSDLLDQRAVVWGE